jgi:hypothetical protein
MGFNGANCPIMVPAGYVPNEVMLGLAGCGAAGNFTLGAGVGSLIAMLFIRLPSQGNYDVLELLW